MSGGNRLFNASLRGCLIGLVLVGLVWPSLAQDDKSAEQPQGQSQADTKQTPAKPPAAPAVSADSPLPKPEPKNDWDPCTDPKHGNESDLCQQWRMAEASEEVRPYFSQIDQNADGGIDLREAQVMADGANNP